MSLMTTVRCRTAQVFVRLGRRLHPMRRQTMETGAGAVFAVGQCLRDMQVRKPLVVLGVGELQTGFKLTHALEDEAIEFVPYEDLPAEPTAEDAEQISRRIREEGCDGVVALGDGLVLDAAKAAAARSVSRNRTVLDMVGVRRAPHRKLPPVVAVPTVGGSGREAISAVLVTDGHGNRFVLEDEALMPAVAILDPELLADAPREKVADAGLDGLCWAVETYLSAPYGSNRDMSQAAQAAELLFASLEGCWNTGGTVKERSDVLTASRMVGRVASAQGGGYVRALIRATQSVCGLDFRTACGVLLPAVLEKYGNYAADRLSRLAVLADVAEDGSRDERVAALISRIRGTVFRMGLPDMLEGVTAAQAAEIADLAAAMANPRYVSPVVWTATECHDVILSVCAPEEG